MSVQDEELVPVRVIFPNREGERFVVRGSKEQKWYYIFGQTLRENMLIKCFDSKTDGRARRAPHSAFVSEEFVDRDTRESIEVRAFLCHPDDTERPE
jgi:arylamine N-acetyltransferase